MSETIIVSIISGLCVAVPSVASLILSNKRNNDLVIYRIGELEKKVNKHNNLVERMYKVEEKLGIVEAKTKIMEGKHNDN